MSKLWLDIVTPDRVEFSQEVTMVIAPGVQGYLGVMVNHMPLITALQTGELRVLNGEKEMLFAVSEGYMEVTGKKVLILAEAAEMAENIDVERALEAKRRAEKRLLNRGPMEIDTTRAKRSLIRAINRLKIADIRKKRT